MFETLASVFSLVMQPCYSLTGSWWLAILLFTAIVKVVLMPLSLWCQWNSIVMVCITPALNRLKVKYFGDQETIGEEQSKLNKEYHYHPLLSLIPLAVQIIILFGLVDVIHGITDGGAPGTEFLGMVPMEDGGASLVMPFLAALSSAIMGESMNRINPLQKEQSRVEQNTTNGISIVISLVLGFSVSAGMAFYWICSNLLSILVQVACNVIMPAKKYVDYDELAASKAELDALNTEVASKTPWYKPDPLARRAKRDYKRFFSTANKHLVWYSERSGFYKYFQGAIEWLLANSNVRIHYITGDPDDQVFEIAKTNPRLMPYYLDQRRMITLFMKMDADVVVSTLEDLDNYYLKRSYVRKDVKYLYMPHAMTSFTLTAQFAAYDHHDAILCPGPAQVAEIHRLEEMRNLPAKKTIHYGYALLDKMIEDYAARPKPVHEKPLVLIGPSWQKDNILDLCASGVIDPLIEMGCRVIVRPHPEYVKRYRPRLDALMASYAGRPEDEISFETDFSSNDSVYDCDVLITDWSAIAYEFSFTTEKPCVFIDTPMKVLNPHWQEVGLEPTDLSLRHEVGVSVDPEHLDELPAAIRDMLDNPEAWSERIRTTREATIYNLGHAGEVAGRYILNSLLARQDGKELPDE